jgi:hypothetical protein
MHRMSYGANPPLCTLRPYQGYQMPIMYKFVPNLFCFISIALTLLVSCITGTLVLELPVVVRTSKKGDKKYLFDYTYIYIYINIYQKVHHSAIPCHTYQISHSCQAETLIQVESVGFFCCYE